MTTTPGTTETEIGALLAALYEVISFEEGGEPDWERMKTLFSPHARLTHVTPEGVDHLDLAAFQRMGRELIELGTYTSFHERESRRCLHVFGDVAHVLSAYETRRAPDALEPFARGVNSIQLVREGPGWRVLSLLWDEERPDNPLLVDEVFEARTARRGP